jgi:hypothetical protein
MEKFPPPSSADPSGERSMDENPPDITVQRINQILKTVFELLWFEPQGLYASEIIRYVKKSMAITEYENGYYPYAPDMPRYEAIIRIGTVPFERVGWLEKTTHGRWYLTGEGRNACMAIKDSDVFFEVSAQMFKEWKESENQRLTLLENDAFLNASEFSREQIRHFFQVMDIKDIHFLVAALLKALDCHVSWTGPMDNKDSAEMICFMDPLGVKTSSLRVHVSKPPHQTSMEEVKTYVQDLEANSVVVFFSLGGILEGVKEFALSLKQVSVRLIDLERFVELWLENIAKIDKVAITKFPIRPVYFIESPRSNNQFAIQPVNRGQD